MGLIGQVHPTHIDTQIQGHWVLYVTATRSISVGRSTARLLLPGILEILFLAHSSRQIKDLKPLQMPLFTEAVCNSKQALNSTHFMKSPGHAHAYKMQRTRRSPAIVAVCLLFDDYFKDTLPASFCASAPVLKVLRKKKDLKAMLAHREQNDKHSAVSRVRKFREKLRIISKKWGNLESVIRTRESIQILKRNKYLKTEFCI